MTKNVSIAQLSNSEDYKKFLKDNVGVGCLKIRAFTANQALPLENVHIVVSKEIGFENVVFFDGYSNSSGVFDSIFLPTSKFNLDNNEIPHSIKYLVSSAFNGVEKKFFVNVYDGICVVQNISFVPEYGGDFA